MGLSGVPAFITRKMENANYIPLAEATDLETALQALDTEMRDTRPLILIIDVFAMFRHLLGIRWLETFFHSGIGGKQRNRAEALEYVGKAWVRDISDRLVLALNITRVAGAVMVWDGFAVPAAKAKETQRRRAEHAKLQRRLDGLLTRWQSLSHKEQGQAQKLAVQLAEPRLVSTIAQQYWCQQPNSIQIRLQDLPQLADIISDHRIQVLHLQSYSEADVDMPIISQVVSPRLYPTILSIDSDVLAHRHWLAWIQPHKEVFRVHGKTLLYKALAIEDEDHAALAVFSGCDYSAGIFGVGIFTVQKLGMFSLEAPSGPNPLLPLSL